MRSIKQDTAKYQEYSPFIWTVSNVVLPEGDGQWDFAEREWQIPILEDTYPEIVVKKAAQVGMTTCFLCKALWFMHRKKVNSIWSFPRQDDITVFVQARFRPMIRRSPNLKRMVASGPGSPDSVRLTQFGDSFIYFQEASVEPRETPADLVVNDEIDRSDPQHLDAFHARLAASKYQYHYRFSTPTISGFGVDKIFKQETDMRYWMVRCSHCGERQHLEWDTHFQIDEGVAYYACKKCGGVIEADDIVEGEWVAMRPSRGVHGYHVSGMMLPYSHPPQSMYNEYQRRQLRNFYNLLLGETYETAMGSISREIIERHCFGNAYPMQRSAKGSNIYMGVDQARDLHVVIGESDGEHHRVIYAEVIPKRSGVDSWARLAQLMRDFNVRFCVVDATPNLHNAIDFKDGFPGKVAIKFDTEKPELVKYDRQEGEVHVSRTQNFDGLRDEIKNDQWSLWGTTEPLHPTVNEIIVHCSNMKRDEEERQQRSGAVQVVGVWRKTGPDHLAHAWAYLRAAMKVRPAGRVTVELIGVDSTDDSTEMVESSVWSGRKVPKKKREIIS